MNLETAYENLLNALKEELFNIRKVGHFEKVSFEQYLKDMKSEFKDTWSDDEIRCFYNNIKLPVRATRGSSGYDFFSPIPLTLNPWDAVKFPTGVQAVIDQGWWLCCMPRSGSGFKHFVRLANTIGNIDSDFWASSNEGDIWAKLRVERADGNLKIESGEAFMQGVFLPFGITYDDAADGVRDGGLGSTKV